MKTKPLKLVSFLLITFLISGCAKNCYDMSFSIEKNDIISQKDHDICISLQAVLLPESKYNTIDGTAILYIPVPKGHSLKKVKHTKSKIIFETNGGKFTKDFDLYKIGVAGLKKKPKSKLFVEITMKFTDGDDCDPDKLGEKFKKSEVQGTP